MLPNGISTSSDPQQSTTPSLTKDSVEKSNGKASGRWTKEEHQRFIDGLKKFGKNWKQVEDYVGTRNGAQIRSHAQKFFNRLEREYNAKSDENNVIPKETKEKPQPKKQKKVSVRKSSECSESTNISGQENLPDERSKALELSARADTFSCEVDASKLLSQETSMDPERSTNLNSFEAVNNIKPPSPQIKVSQQTEIPNALSQVSLSSLSLFNLIMSRYQLLNRLLNPPKLSDLVEMKAPVISAYGPLSINTQLINKSFKPNPKKISQEKDKVFEERKPDYSDLENLGKKVKVDNEVF